MAAKSPTVSVKSREIIGGEQFNTRREIFDKHDTVFLPASPTATSPSYVDVDPIITSNHGKTTTNFKRNTPNYSSMRETRGTREENVEFRVRKYSDNFTSENYQSDYPEYRANQIERNRRLSKLRREFLANTLQDPAALARSGVRATMPARAASLNYKLEGPKLVNFPFLEPYGTPPPARKELETTDGTANKDKENQDPEQRQKYYSTLETPGKVDQQKLFEDLVKRYSPQKKPVDWTLPPTKPRIVDYVQKSTSESIGSGTSKLVNGDENVFDKEKEVANVTKENERDSTISGERAENNDCVPELVEIRKESDKPVRRHTVGEPSELTMPGLIDKITAEAKELENHTNDKVKIKKKRSFLDKLLGRKKGTKPSESITF